MTATQPETFEFAGDGAFPNSPLPVLVYRGLDVAGDPARAEQAFATNNWLGAWRDGIFGFHHFHSTAHEVLAIVGGEARVTLGGPSGRTFDVNRGDVLVLPAGTGHRNQGSSADFLVVGAYPDGMDWDLRRGDPAEYADAQRAIDAVPLPEADPVGGADGPLRRLWQPGVR